MSDEDDLNASLKLEIAKSVDRDIEERSHRSATQIISDIKDYDSDGIILNIPKRIGNTKIGDRRIN